MSDFKSIAQLCSEAVVKLTTTNSNDGTVEAWVRSNLGRVVDFSHVPVAYDLAAKRRERRDLIAAVKDYCAEQQNGLSQLAVVAGLDGAVDDASLLNTLQVASSTASSLVAGAAASRYLDNVMAALNVTEASSSAALGGRTYSDIVRWCKVNRLKKFHDLWPSVFDELRPDNRVQSSEADIVGPSEAAAFGEAHVFMTAAQGQLTTAVAPGVACFGRISVPVAGTIRFQRIPGTHNAGVGQPFGKPLSLFQNGIATATTIPSGSGISPKIDVHPGVYTFGIAADAGLAVNVPQSVLVTVADFEPAPQDETKLADLVGVPDTFLSEIFSVYSAEINWCLRELRLYSKYMRGRRRSCKQLFLQSVICRGDPTDAALITAMQGDPLRGDPLLLTEWFGDGGDPPGLGALATPDRYYQAFAVLNIFALMYVTDFEYHHERAGDDS